ncbi:DNA-binding NarL/FixJ family response regulator [Flavobacterium sp. CG_23.5]|uniref:response regulator transcription factor n=1 Tax=unclassified Flavobacterium TaxID=196869 RepID=UPI0018C9458A|nr:MULTISPECIES: response regulator transcription factor [unclassified Flavobacterium]MBG6112044.1 DNA-binding NarL/FixJ family response regulator [Flavobacterium sp. CG_9.10]MBP2282748.1 DNA-binding NarL/FixJ family response regulator [Flavobacterium sp. CG_23.5]
MFNKVLVAEDLDSISIAVVQALEEISIVEIHHSKYCDDAFLKVKKALHDNVPYDLLISDLSFKTDHRENRLNSGEELIEAVKNVQPDIKTIVFSIEDKSFRIQSLFNNLGINAYVSKGRKSIPELQNAIQRIHCTDEKIISSELSHTLKDKSIFEIEAYDISLLKLLSKGLILEEISENFKESGIIPNGSSSIEKRINKLKVYFKANNNVHLIALTKDLGLV